MLLLAAVPLYADDAEDQAVKAVETLGGKVIRDDKDPAHPVVEVDSSSTTPGVDGRGPEGTGRPQGAAKVILVSAAQA